MPRPIDRDELQRLLADGAQLVEVLPREEFDDHHLPGALNMTLGRIETDAPGRLEAERPVVVYCWDSA